MAGGDVSELAAVGGATKLAVAGGVSKVTGVAVPSGIPRTCGWRTERRM